MAASTLMPVSPAVEAIAARVRQANAERRPLRVVGAGTWRGGPPIDATAEVTTTSLSEVVDYVPGDLTITVGAGTTLAAIERVTAEHGQWLTLDPYGSPEGTIGATIATASSGPLTTAFGAPRDLVLGIEAVSGTGSVVRAGGKVVKNVAGFDLSRLFTGSRGTIGVITEVSLRLRARPALDETIAVPLPDKPTAIRDVHAALRSWPATPMAAEIIDRETSSALGMPASRMLIVRFGGNARSLTAQRRRATMLGKWAVVEPSLWTRLRTLADEQAVSFRITDHPSAFADRWEDARALAALGAHIVGSPLRGQLRFMMPTVDRAAIATFRSRVQSAVVVFDALPSVTYWNGLTSIPESTTLHGRIREAFDPAGIMNPGAMRIAR